ncbi:Endonuclease YncB, thermonuclease family [Cetobacterium ceti]|uniref:Endonuclease YncB, thermonuclease family n=1 Tax=Cetobacterium ceti TaxID=180163 RepID=A0A1T4PFT1_9FUSO|nr:thermonuclease family protein [Cetobacterium ceti]SJZ90231.1 Endonuclease YncB, thermonuclease family [Cetobacterium ceti]
MKKIFLLLMILLMSTYTFALEGKVIKVADGDTITILDHHKKVKVRFYGIDAPEKTQEYGMKSKDILDHLLYGKYVNIDVKDIDQYGRTVGIVYYKHKNINVEMVKNGNAWWYKRYSKDNMELAAAEIYAKQEKKGLWEGKNPIAPWKYRKLKKDKVNI